MKRKRMPSWAEYQQLNDDQRERLYLHWCWENNRGPEAEGSGYAFVESMPWTATGLEPDWNLEEQLEDSEVDLGELDPEQPE